MAKRGIHLIFDCFFFFLEIEQIVFDWYFSELMAIEQRDENRFKHKEINEEHFDRI